jgi:hypothetical protein
MNRIILYFVFHHGGDDIVCERVNASTSHKDPPSVIPDASGGYCGASISCEACSFNQVPSLLSPLAPFRPLGPGSAGVHHSEGR